MMKKFFCLFFIFLLLTCAKVEAKEWHEGGTLHSSTVAQWKKATPQNKVATCADWIAVLLFNGTLNVNISNVEDFKTLSILLADSVDKEAVKVKNPDKLLTSAVAYVEMANLGWIKKNHK